jgi:division protein CdvB (Snf7/Vps24/ESCRT-III family)
MPRLALAKLPLEALRAEIHRRAKKAHRQLKKLLRHRSKLDAAIAQLHSIVGKPMEALEKFVKGKPAAKPVARRKRKK